MFCVIISGNWKGCAVGIYGDVMSVYKINIDDKLKDYEIEILKNLIKKDLHYLIHSQCNHIYDIDLSMNRRINNTIKKLKMIKNKLNDLENEKTKVIEEEIKVWKGEN